MLMRVWRRCVSEEWSRGVDRFKLIHDLPVVDVASGRTLKLREIAQPYSPEWLAAMV